MLCFLSRFANPVAQYDLWNLANFLVKKGNLENFEGFQPKWAFSLKIEFSRKNRFHMGFSTIRPTMLKFGQDVALRGKDSSSFPVPLRATSWPYFSIIHPAVINPVGKTKTWETRFFFNSIFGPPTLVRIGTLEFTLVRVSVRKIPNDYPLYFSEILHGVTTLYGGNITFSSFWK